MDLEKIRKDLPKGPGVYLFYQGEIPLYIGKSVSLKDRILQHFAAKTTKEQRYTRQADRIDFIETAGNFGAEVREARLVKELYPIFNRQLRRLKQVVAVKLTAGKGGYFYPEIFSSATDFKPDQLEDLYIFPHRGFYQRYLDSLVHELGLCKVRLKLEQGNRCFLSWMGKCQGACSGRQSAADYNELLITHFRRYYLRTWPFKGPVSLQETYDDFEESFTIENWKIVGATRHGHKHTSLETKTETSLDEYRIILKHLKLVYPEYLG